MDPNTQKILGYALLAGGLGAGGYALYAYTEQRRQAAIKDVILDVAPVVDDGVLVVPGTRQRLVADISWENPTALPVTYGVQGAVIQQPPLGIPDVVGGRWWTSAAALSQAEQGMVLGPDARVSRVTIPAGQRGGVLLYSHPTIVSGEEFWFWIRRDPPADAKLVDDAIETPKTALPEPQKLLVF